MDNKGTIEWRLIFLILVIVGLIVGILLIVSLFYSSQNGTNPFNFFANLFGGR